MQYFLNNDTNNAAPHSLSQRRQVRERKSLKEKGRSSLISNNCTEMWNKNFF